MSKKWERIERVESSNNTTEASYLRGKLNTRFFRHPFLKDSLQFGPYSIVFNICLEFSQAHKSCAELCLCIF